MKIWILALLISTNAYAIPPDKISHFSTSALCTIVLSDLMAKDWPKFFKIVIPMTTCWAVGYTKEMSDRHFDSDDIVANSLGVVSAGLYLRFRF